MLTARLSSEWQYRTALSLVDASGVATTLTFADLVGRVAALRDTLQKLGVGPGDRLMTLTGNPLRTIEGILAAIDGDGGAVPVNPGLGAAGLAQVLVQLRPACCLVDEASGPHLEQVLSDLGGAAWAVASVPTAERCRLYRLAYRAADVEPTAISGPDTQAALIMLSSGSEGVPKAIRMTRAQLDAFLSYHDVLYSQYVSEAQRGTPFVSALPLTHLGGLGVCLQALTTGRPIHLVLPFVPDRYLEVVQASQCNTLMLVPGMFTSLLRYPRLRPSHTDSVQFCITLGEPCAAELEQEIAERFSATVTSAYGLTECLTGIGYPRADLLDGGVRRGSCGRLLFGEARLGEQSAVGTSRFGELWVKNPTVHECYLDEAMNKARFVDGWFRTNDLFSSDDDGYYFYRGRADDMFVYNGENIYPADIEAALRSHPSVQSVCGGPVMNGRGVRVPAALVVAQGTVAKSDLLKFALRNAPAYVVPHFIEFAADVPRLASGKTDRRSALRMLQSSFEASWRC
jgi:long-chain acyl-CoA synthetase